MIGERCLLKARGLKAPVGSGRARWAAHLLPAGGTVRSRTQTFLFCTRIGRIPRQNNSFSALALTALLLHKRGSSLQPGRIPPAPAQGTRVGRERFEGLPACRNTFFSFPVISIFYTRKITLRHPIAVVLEAGISKGCCNSSALLFVLTNFSCA